MADNVAITAGSGTTIATDEVGSAHHQKVKVEFGENGTATEVSAANPLPVGDGGSSLTVDGTVAVSGEPTVKVNSALPAGANSIGTVVLGAGSAEAGKVKVTELPALPAGTNAIGQVDPRGNVAHDSADSGNPVKVGGRARTTHTAAIANDDRSDLTTDKYGRLLTAGFIPDTKVSGRVTLENETSTTVLEAPGASIRLVVTSIVVTNAGSTAGRLEILDESTAKMIQYAAKEGGGWSITDPNGLFIVTENKPLKAKALATSKFDVFVSAYKIPA